MEMDMTIDVDEQEVLDNLDPTEIFDKSQMTVSDCKDYFKTALLDEFTPQEIIDYLGDEPFLDIAGSKRVIEYFGIEEKE